MPKLEQFFIACHHYAWHHNTLIVSTANELLLACAACAIPSPSSHTAPSFPSDLKLEHSPSVLPTPRPDLWYPLPLPSPLCFICCRPSDSPSATQARRDLWYHCIEPTIDVIQLGLESSTIQHYSVCFEYHRSIRCVAAPSIPHRYCQRPRPGGIFGTTVSNRLLM